jgi:protein-L-isoaspartate(D-aspartate) O-methyltransferase
MSSSATLPDSLEAARKQMVEHQIRARGVCDPRVLNAMTSVLRERFIPYARRDAAYDDRALPLDCGQTISQPFMVAYMTELLEVDAKSKVLEVGTGSGYQAAILAKLARVVHTIERLETLRLKAEQTLRSLGIANVIFHVGDGTLGLPTEAPFDRIMVTAGAPRVPQRLVDQLVEGGRMVIPVGEADEQTVMLIVRQGARAVETPMLACRFVPLIGDQGWRLETRN